MGSQSVGFVGLGRIGFPVALNIARAGFPLRAYDLAVRPEYAEQLEAEGASVVERVEEVAEGTDVLVTLLPDSDAVRSVLLSPPVRGGLRSGAVCIEMSSGFPPDTLRIGADLAEGGVELLDAPICNGGVPGAYKGRLTLCVGGEAEVLQHVRPILDPVAASVLHVGPLGSGHAIKLVSNYVALGVTGLMSEAFAIAMASGFSFDDIEPTLQECVVGRFVHLEHLSNVLRSARAGGDDEARFTLGLARKDLRYVVAHAAEKGVFSPIADAVHEQYLAAERSGLADLEATWAPWRLLSELWDGGGDRRDAGRGKPGA